MPDCSSLIVSEETGDYIIEYNSLYFEQIQRQDGVCISCINDTWCILYTNYPGSRNINIQQGYYSVPKLYGLMDTTSFDASGITDRKSTRLNSSHNRESRMPSSA